MGGAIVSQGTFGKGQYVADCHKGVLLLVSSWGEANSKHHTTDKSPTTKNYMAQNVISAKAGTP